MGLKRPTGDELARAIAERTGHAFADLRLLETALTHSSAVRAMANNERLEFLGDRVLGLIVADMLFRQFPDASEGEIAPRFNALVDARTCAQVGVELELDRFVRADAALKARMRGSGGNYLADAVEALIAAIYLDGGLEAARGFILRLWQPRIHTVLAKPPNPNGPYGLYQVSFTGFSEVYQRFGSGIGQVAMHGTNRPELIGTPASHGCVRMTNEDIAQMVNLAPRGTPVVVVA